MADELNEEIPTPDPIIDRLRPFVEANLGVTLTRRGGVVVADNPWGDSTVRFVIEDNSPVLEHLIEALNSIYLPSKLIAIWHRDTRDLEFIYTALPADNDELGRGFRFMFRGKEILCEYADASIRLMLLAHSSRFGREPTRTSYRNVQRFQAGMIIRSENRDAFPPGATAPRSFWLRDVEWDETYILDLALHINFYAHYFDRQTALIVILEDDPQPILASAERYPHGNFPAVITARDINTYLLSLVMSCLRDDPIRRVIHSFQVLEYVAFYYVKSDVSEAVRTVLVAPNALDRLELTTEKVVEAVGRNFQDDDNKMRSIVKNLISPDVLWSVIGPHIDTFSQRLEFDGGLVLTPLVIRETTAASQQPSLLDGFFDQWKILRNVIVHAREKKHTEWGLEPTSANMQKLRPWAELCVLAAEQLIALRNN